MIALAQRGAGRTPDEPKGFDAKRLRILDAHLRRYIDDGRLAGLTCFVSRFDETAYVQALGLRDVDAGAPMTLDTIVRAYSLTKPVTAAAVLALMEDGRLLLTDPIIRFLPEFGNLEVLVGEGSGRSRLEPLDRPITVLDLLTHTAGFGYGQHTGHPVDDLYREAELFGGGTEPLETMLRKLARLPLKHQPGHHFEYSVAYDVLGGLVEAASGMPFGAFLSQRLFEPLGMADTAFEVPEHKLDRFGALYSPTMDGKVELLEAPQAPRFRPPVRMHAGGQGLVSTLPDFLRFVRMLYHGGALDGARCLSRKSVSLMTCNHLSPSQMEELWMKGHGYGLGVGVLFDVAAHGHLGTAGSYTWAGSASTYFWVDPSEELIGILFAQLEPSSALPIANEFKTLMYQALN